MQKLSASAWDSSYSAKDKIFLLFYRMWMARARGCEICTSVFGTQFWMVASKML